MGIALLAIADLFTPLQSLASRWLPARDARHRATAGLRYVAVRPACGTRTGAATSAAPREKQATSARRNRFMRGELSKVVKRWRLLTARAGAGAGRCPPRRAS